MGFVSPALQEVLCPASSLEHGDSQSEAFTGAFLRVIKPNRHHAAGGFCVACDVPLLTRLQEPLRWGLRGGGGRLHPRWICPTPQGVIPHSLHGHRMQGLVRMLTWEVWVQVLPYQPAKQPQREGERDSHPRASILQNSITLCPQKQPWPSAPLVPPSLLGMLSLTSGCRLGGIQAFSPTPSLRYNCQGLPDIHLSYIFRARWVPGGMEIPLEIRAREAPEMPSPGAHLPQTPTSNMGQMQKQQGKDGKTHPRGDVDPAAAEGRACPQILLGYTSPRPQ